MPESVKPNDLDRGARGELRTLSKENADEVARHLVMAGRLVEEDPEEAHRHALAAARRAGRVAVVRESLAITAYATGDFALALRELRTFRRISGSDDQIGLMVDSERGVGRPDRALELGRSVDRTALPLEAQVALSIAMSGARLDLEDPRGALDELERAPLDLQRVHPWSSTLYEALAAVHEDLGDAEEAQRWQRRAERADELLDQVGEEESTIDVSTEIDPDRVVQPESDEDEDEVDEPVAAEDGASADADAPGPEDPAEDSGPDDVVDDQVDTAPTGDGGPGADTAPPPAPDDEEPADAAQEATSGDVVASGSGEAAEVHDGAEAEAGAAASATTTDDVAAAADETAPALEADGGADTDAAAPEADSEQDDSGTDRPAARRDGEDGD